MSALYDDPLFSDLTNSQTETITENRKRGKSRDGSCSRPHKLKTKKMSKSTKQKKVEKERSERSKKLEGSKNKKLKLNANDLVSSYLEKEGFLEIRDEFLNAIGRNENKSPKKMKKLKTNLKKSPKTKKGSKTIEKESSNQLKSLKKKKGSKVSERKSPKKLKTNEKKISNQLKSPKKKKGSKTIQKKSPKKSDKKSSTIGASSPDEAIATEQEECSRIKNPETNGRLPVSSNIADGRTSSYDLYVFKYLISNPDFLEVAKDFAKARGPFPGMEHWSGQIDANVKSRVIVITFLKKIKVL